MIINIRPASAEEKELFHVSVEIITRIECTKAGKGWWFRFKKRHEIVRKLCNNELDIFELDISD